jgi:hypothetical protein
MQNSKNIFRWTLGFQNTFNFQDHSTEENINMLWMTKLSIASFYKFFQSDQFYLLYNGKHFAQFRDLFYSHKINTDYVQLIDQGTLNNPYHFIPRGVWWKWIPFRIDIHKTEICIDTDIICLTKPSNIIQWINNDIPILIAPERYEKVNISTCGDFFNQPLLKNKTPYNCGLVGQKKGCSFEDRFFDITKLVDLGSTHNSLFITEQGAINFWIRSLELEGIQHESLNFEKNAWIRDFIYYINKEIQVETVHAVSWYKSILFQLKDVFEKIVFQNDYTLKNLLIDLLKNVKKLDNKSKFIIINQLNELKSGSY